MRTYRNRTVSELDEVSCDRCQRQDEATGMEGQEFLSWSMSCGFASVFGDLNHVDLDLCQHCVKELLGQWVRVTEQE
jgi:hypothetical protein